MDIHKFISAVIGKLPVATSSQSKIKIKIMADEKAVARPMKYPYTFSAKVAQFPFRFYWNNLWMFKYYAISLGVCLPIFYKIHKLANSPGNVAKWAEKRRQEAEEHHH